MDVKEKALYSELRTTRIELLESLMYGKGSPLIKPLIEAELIDVEYTLEKLAKGNFGICELSGEFIPPDLLQIVPTIKTITDCRRMDDYFRKGFYE